MKKALGIVGLIIIGGIFGYIIAQGEKKQNQTVSIEDLIRRHIEETRRMEKELFDSIFTDSFFSRDYNPFKEIYEFKRKMQRLFDDSQTEKIFTEGFEKWVSDRIISLNNNDADIYITTLQNDKEYVVEIENKNGNNANLSIEVKNDYIKISYEKQTQVNKQNKEGKLNLSSYIKKVKYFSLPDYISGKEHSIEKKDNRIIIRFKK